MRHRKPKVEHYLEGGQVFLGQSRFFHGLALHQPMKNLNGKDQQPAPEAVPVCSLQDDREQLPEELPALDPP